MFKNVSADPMMAGMFDGMKANLSDDAMKNLFTQSFAQFPDKPIKVGDDWNGQVSTANPMLGTLVTSSNQPSSRSTPMPAAAWRMWPSHCPSNETRRSHRRQIRRA